MWVCLQVEQVIREQNMLDAFVMIENYCHLLIERVVLIQKNKCVVFSPIPVLNFISELAA